MLILLDSRLLGSDEFVIIRAIDSFPSPLVGEGPCRSTLAFQIYTPCVSVWYDQPYPGEAVPFGIGQSAVTR